MWYACNDKFNRSESELAMKRTTRTILFLVLAVVLALTLGVVYAQDEDFAGFPEDLSGFIIQPALSGEFAANEDDTFTLSLQSVAAFNSWVFEMPEFSAANHSLAEFAGDWSSGEGITAEAVLQLDGMTVNLMLSAPVYYLVDGTFSFTATINEIISDSAPKKGGPVLPETFGFATLIIRFDAQFATEYLGARLARLSDARPDVQDACYPFGC